MGSWSRDGQWIYFASDRSGRLEVWKMPAEGGPAVQVTRDGATAPVESWDGRHVYYSKPPGWPAGVWKVPVDGGEEIDVLARPEERRFDLAVGWDDSWALSRGGIYFVTGREVVRRRREEFSIRFLDFASGQVTEIRRDEGPFSRWMLEVSPDEEWILYGQMPAWESELMLVESFR